MKYYAINNKLFNVFIFLFIFTSINREFLLFGIDLRYILVPLMILLLIKVFTIKKISVTKLDISFFLLYVLMAISLIAYQYNGLNISSDVLKNLIFLHILNFIAFFIMFLNKNLLSKKKIYNYVIISSLILIGSMLILYFGGSLGIFMDTTYNGLVDSSIIEHTNFFGQNFRVAGFAQDANYATIFCVIALFCSMEIINKFKKYIFIFLCLFAIAISWSKTIVVALLFLPFIYIIYRLKYKKNSNSNRFNVMCFIIVLTIFFITILPIETLDLNLQTLTTRFKMWESARYLFYDNMLLGGGLGSFRFYFEQTGNWLVQSHNTYWQTLSETGILGLTTLLSIIYFNLKVASKKHFMLICVISIWALTYELLYLQIFIIIYYLFVNLREEDNFEK